MTRSLPAFLMLVAASIARGSSAPAPTTLQVLVAANGNSYDVGSGGSVILTAGGIGPAVLATVTVRYTGTSSATITGLSVSGGADIALVGSPSLPVTLSPTGTTSFLVQYLPSTANSISSQVSIVYSENAQPAVFTFTVNGTTPDLTFTIFLSPNGPLTSLTPGSLIPFPAVSLGSSASAILNISNRGSAAGSLQSINLSSADYQLTGPPLPAVVQPGQQLSFNIVFTPHVPGPSSALLTVALNTGSITFFLSGSTATAELTATYTLADGIVRALSDGAAINFPTGDVNTTTAATITILNKGAGTGTITGISVTGAGFSLAGSPTVPVTVGAGQSLHFGIVFAPTHGGKFVGAYSINLGGAAIGGALTATTSLPTLVISYALADGAIRTLSDGTAISFPAVDINAITPATITIANQGPGAGTVAGIFLTGAGFQLSGTPPLPAAIAANQSLTFAILFAPSKAGAFNGTFRIDLAGTSLNATLAASTALSKFTLSYLDVDTNNTLPLTNNATLPFPNTPSGTTFSISLMAVNTGAGTGSINSIALGSSASAFQLLNLPALPLSVAPSQQLRFGVRFSPQQEQNSSDTLRIDFNGQVIVINLRAMRTQPQFSYGLAKGSVTTLLSPGGNVAMSDTAVGQSSSVVVSVSNFGTGDGQISTISVTGQGFSLTELPTLPFTLHPNGSQQFTLTFAPTQPAGINGRLTIGNDTFTVTGTGIGSRLVYTYTTAVSTIPVADGGTVIFPAFSAGSTENLSFSVQNTGTGSATISSIDLAAPSTSFSLSRLPALPISLEAGATLAFAIGFVPSATGSLNATLRVDGASFTLSGSGTQPAPLPTYQFQGPAGIQPAAQQPAFGLTLDATYPLPLQGTLTLAFLSMVAADDPSIQFVSGGRTVKFTIPANSNQALFNGTATSIALLTGTTAGNIVITPSFALTGGFDLTPSSPATLALTIQRSPPQLVSAGITSQTLTSFTVIINGYATTHTLRQLDIQFTPKQGQNFPVTHLTIDLSAVSAVWFQSAASKGFGGSFVVALPFNLSNGNTAGDLVHLLQSLSITVSNDEGTSSAVSVPIP